MQDCKHESRKTLKNEKLTVTFILRVYCHAREKLPNLRTEKEILKECIKHVIVKAAKPPKAHAEAFDWVLNSLKEQFSSLPMRVSRQILACSEKKVSELRHYASRNIREWRGRDKECSKESLLGVGRL